MLHRNAALVPRARLRLARLIVDDGWPVAQAAQRFQVSWRTAKRWADRYREQGAEGMADRSSRPKRSPARTPQPVVRKIVHLRWKQRLGPVQIAGRLGMPASTVYAVLTRCRLNRLSHLDRVTGEVIRRYEHDQPGAMLHVDVTKYGNIPDGGGWRYVGRVRGRKHREATEVLVTVGVDTHADVHVAVALDQLGRRIGANSFGTTPTGYAELERWAATLGTIAAFGIEGTGSWGAGLVRHLRAARHLVVEVNRPDRSARRRQGKSDTLDAQAAARAVLAGTATAQPKTADGDVELIRTLMVTRRSAMKARTQTVNQLGALLVTAPAELREQLRNIPTKQLVDVAAGWRPGAHPSTAMQVTKLAMRSLARRYQQLDEEITVLDRHLARLTEQAAPQLVAVKGLGTQTVAGLLVAAGDNPDRMRSESAFAHLCGAAPIPASSGKVQRHRLNRGGDRQANWALYILAVTGHLIPFRPVSRKAGRNQRQLWVDSPANRRLIVLAIAQRIIATER